MVQNYEKAEWQAIDVFLFSNGQQDSPPRKYHLTVSELDFWDQTLERLADFHYGCLNTMLDIYTIDGRVISNPISLKNGGTYVAVMQEDEFKPASYQKYIMKASRSWEKRHSKKCCHYENLLNKVDPDPIKELDSEILSDESCVECCPCKKLSKQNQHSEVPPAHTIQKFNNMPEQSVPNKLYPRKRKRSSLLNPAPIHAVQNRAPNQRKYVAQPRLNRTILSPIKRKLKSSEIKEIGQIMRTNKTNLPPICDTSPYVRKTTPNKNQKKVHSNKINEIFENENSLIFSSSNYDKELKDISQKEKPTEKSKSEQKNNGPRRTSVLKGRLPPRDTSTPKDTSAKEDSIPKRPLPKRPYTSDDISDPKSTSNDPKIPSDNTTASKIPSDDTPTPRRISIPNDEQQRTANEISGPKRTSASSGSSDPKRTLVSDDTYTSYSTFKLKISPILDDISQSKRSSDPQRKLDSDNTSLSRGTDASNDTSTQKRPLASKRTYTDDATFEQKRAASDEISESNRPSASDVTSRSKRTNGSNDSTQPTRIYDADDLSESNKPPVSDDISRPTRAYDADDTSELKRTYAPNHNSQPKRSTVSCEETPTPKEYHESDNYNNDNEKTNSFINNNNNHMLKNDNENDICDNKNQVNTTMRKGDTLNLQLAYDGQYVKGTLVVENKNNEATIDEIDFEKKSATNLNIYFNDIEEGINEDKIHRAIMPNNINFHCECNCKFFRQSVLNSNLPKSVHEGTFKTNESDPQNEAVYVNKNVEEIKRKPQKVFTDRQTETVERTLFENIVVPNKKSMKEINGTTRNVSTQMDWDDVLFIPERLNGQLVLRLPPLKMVKHLR